MSFIRFVAGAFLALFAIAGAFVALVFALTTGIVEGVDRHLDALRSGNLEAAYNETSATFRDAVPSEDFRKFISKYPMLRRNRSAWYPRRSINNFSGEVEAVLTDAAGAKITVTYFLQWESGSWRISGYTIGAKSAALSAPGNAPVIAAERR